MLTSTLKVELMVPPGPVAVAVYAVGLVGDTTTDPLGGSAPILLSILTLSALVDVHLKVVLPPWVMLDGLAAKEMVGGNTTVIVAAAVTIPAAPVAVAV